jgi:uncharacterized membrane protein
MTLTFCNEYSSLISVAIAYYNPSQCANSGNWTKVGWYNIPTNSCRVVSNSNLASVNSNWLYYAFSSDKTGVWAGNYSAYVTPDRFNMCWDEPKLDPGHARAYKVGFKLLNIGSNSSYTLRFTSG